MLTRSPYPSRQGVPSAEFIYSLAPVLFVVLWSTGFVGGRYGLPYAEPFTLLSLRFAVALVILGEIMLLSRTEWPADLRQAGHIAVVGVLANSGYLGGMFYAMATGMPLGAVALIGGLQPLLTAVLVGPVLNEAVSRRAWIGLLIGLGGVVLVILPKLGASGIAPGGLLATTLALLCMTAATLYQKRFCPRAPLKAGAAIQFAAALMVTAALAMAFETRAVLWTPQLVLSVLWLAGALSVGALTILWMLMRRGGAAKVSSMFYLIPPVTALLAYVLFGEALDAVQITGFAIAVGGVALVSHGARQQNR